MTTAANLHRIASSLRRLRVDLDDAGHIGALDARSVDLLATAIEGGGWDEHAWHVLYLKESLRKVATDISFGMRVNVRAVALAARLAILREEVG